MSQIIKVDTRNASPSCPDAISCTLPFVSAVNRQAAECQNIFRNDCPMAIYDSLKVINAANVYAVLSP